MVLNVQFLLFESPKIPNLQGMDWLHIESLIPHDRFLTLRDEVAQHCFALRLKQGDAVGLVNGCGGRAHCIVATVTRSVVVVEVLQYTVEQRPSDVVLCLSLLDSRERMEFAIEKCTELGVMRIALLATSRSQQRSIRIGRLRQKIHAAVIQSGRSWLPTIDEPVPLQQALDNVKLHTIIVGNQQGAPASALRAPVAVFVGPEGGFSHQESALLLEAGARQWRVSSNRLRTETAAVVLTAAVVQALETGSALPGHHEG